jgi:hypothetical protein
MVKNRISKLSPNIPMKTLIMKIKSLISNLIKSLIKFYIKYCQKLDSKLSPNIPMKTSIIKIQNKTCEVGPR